jgi:hypothetical protein
MHRTATSNDPTSWSAERDLTRRSSLRCHYRPSITQAVIAGGFTGQLLFFVMANIGATIAPWMLFFQQRAVVDKGRTSLQHPVVAAQRLCQNSHI